MTDFETPNIDFSNRDAALQQIWSFVLSFQEQVSFWLRNLDKDSFNAQGLAEITAPISAEIEDVAGNVTTLQVTAEGLQSQVTAADGKASSAQQTADKLQTQVTSVDGKASTALQTANGVQVEVNGLKSRNIVTIDSTGLYVTDAAGQTTKLSGNHITSGTIEGVTLLSKSGNYSVKIEDAQVTLASPSGGGYVKADSSGIHVFGGSVDGPGVSIDCNGGSFALDSAWQKMDATKIKLSTRGNASFDAGGTIYIGASSGYSGNVNIGQSGGTINLNGTVTVNGVPYAPAGGGK